MKAHPVIAASVLLVCGFAHAGAFAEDSSKIYLNGVKSTVKIYDVEDGASGSGSVVNLEEGYILTNWHVVQGGKDVLVVFPLWEKDRPVSESDKYPPRKAGHRAKIVASNPKIDLAIVKILDPKKIPQGTLAVRLADESPLPGSKLVSIGNPGASNGLWIYTPGEVRQVGRKKWETRTGKTVISLDVRVIEATSPVNPGDSGGPCFNEKGEQVGITQGYLPSAQAFSLFIEASEARAYLKANKIPFTGSNDVAEVKNDPQPKTTEPKKEPVPAASEPVKPDPAAEKKAKDEKAAASMLNLLRSVAKDPNRQAFALEKLQALIKLYPKTEAAKEAQTLIDKIK